MMIAVDYTDIVTKTILINDIINNDVHKQSKDMPLLQGIN